MSDSLSYPQCLEYHLAHGTVPGTWKHLINFTSEHLCLLILLSCPSLFWALITPPSHIMFIKGICQSQQTLSCMWLELSQPEPPPRTCWV